MQTSAVTSIDVPPAGEWMRIFACRLARARPELDARAIVHVAMREFGASSALAPEIAVERCVRERLDG